MSELKDFARRKEVPNMDGQLLELMYNHAIQGVSLKKDINNPNRLSPDII
jgi:hypothetical protein